MSKTLLQYIQHKLYDTISISHNNNNNLAITLDTLPKTISNNSLIYAKSNSLNVKTLNQKLRESKPKDSIYSSVALAYNDYKDNAEEKSYKEERKARKIIISSEEYDNTEESREDDITLIPEEPEEFSDTTQAFYGNKNSDSFTENFLNQEYSKPNDPIIKNAIFQRKAILLYCINKYRKNKEAQNEMDTTTRNG